VRAHATSGGVEALAAAPFRSRLGAGRVASQNPELCPTRLVSLRLRGRLRGPVIEPIPPS